MHKLHDIDCNAHSEQILTLIQQANQIERTIWAIDNNNEKHIFKKSFLPCWQMNYTITGQNYSKKTIEATVNFMLVQKTQQDLVEGEKKQAARGMGQGAGQFQNQ